MILVTRFEKEISIKGHALYDDYGKDIVCSAVSSIVITTINALIALDSESLNYKLTNDGIKIEIKKTDKTTLILIDNMLELLMKLSKDYPKNIQVKEGV